MTAESTVETEDRRVRKTRKALIDAFSDIVLVRRYEDIRISEILDQADVGRSTFYSHFLGKDDLLARSMDWMLSVLASMAAPEPDMAAARFLLQHIWENRERGRTILNGQPGAVVMRALSVKLEAGLEEICSQSGRMPPIALRFIANQIAASQFALLQTWIAGEASCSVETLAAMMHKTVFGMVCATIFDAEIASSPLTSPPNRPNALG